MQDVYGYWTRQETGRITEGMHTSPWFQWERETRPESIHYSNYSKAVYIYTTVSIAAFYGVVSMIALILLCITKLCGKRQNKVWGTWHLE